MNDKQVQRKLKEEIASECLTLLSDLGGNMKVVDYVSSTLFGPSEANKNKYPNAEKYHRHFLQAVEITCRIALAAFAAFVAPIPFAISASIGACLGAGYALLVLLKKFHWTSVQNIMPACAQNFMEYLSGTKFPAVVARIVTAVFIGAHIYHDPKFFVPFCGVFLGFWIGKEVVHGCANLLGRGYKKFSPEPCGECCV